MAKGENAFVAWLARRYGPRPRGPDGVVAGIGDDMAILRLGASGETSKRQNVETSKRETRKPKPESRKQKAEGRKPEGENPKSKIQNPKSSVLPSDTRHPTPDTRLLVTCDMLMDGVDFDTRIHTPAQIGRKALAVSLSDCAAMAVRPRWAVVSVALPESWTMARAKGLYLGMEPLAKRYGCRIVGGDTNSWRQGLVIDVTVLAEPWPDVRPVRRDGMLPGDVIMVSGPLGGSLAGHHLTFEPRVWEARWLAERLGEDLHAMMDLSDGLSVDGARMAAASGCGMELDVDALAGSTRPAAEVKAGKRKRMQRVLNDGEDFELLFAIAPHAVLKLMTPEAFPRFGDWPGPMWLTLGEAVSRRGVWAVHRDGKRVRRDRIEPKGWQHFVK